MPMSEYIEKAKDAIVKVFSECKGIDVKRDTIHLETAAQCGGGVLGGKRCRFTIGESCKYYVETYKSDGGKCITVCIYKKFCLQGIVINEGE